MATLLLPPGPDITRPASAGEATFVLVLSPIRDTTGQVRVRRQAMPAGGCLADVLPPGRYQRVVYNGVVLTLEAQACVQLRPGDEVWAFPYWGTGIETGLLLTFAIGLAVSIATTALTYLLFPPAKPHIQASAEEHTFSFEGIRTAIGPGNMVPVIYGCPRIGGQLLSASVEQALTVLDTGAALTRLTAITQPPTLNLLIGLGEGPIDAVLTDTIELNGQPLANFAGVQVSTRLGTPDQTPISEFNETRNTFADGRVLAFDQTENDIVYTTTAAVQALILAIVFNEGLFNVTGKGEKEDNTVAVAYRLRVHGTVDWGPYSSFDVTAQHTAPVRFGIRREGLALAVYDIALHYGALRHNDDLHAKWKPTLESITEIQAGTTAYPNTALLGLRTLATEALQGSLPNVTLKIRGRTVRVGTFSPTETWSDNPAWCIMDAMTNRRYGDGILDSTIDLAAFQVWADYNDAIIDGEKRHTFNYVLEREQRVQSLLLEMMGGSRTLMLKSEGVWTPRPTRNDLPGQLLSWATCSNLKITYTRDPDRVNVMEARYANEEDGFQQDVLTWPTVDNWPLDVHKASLEMRGVTKPSRVMRALQFELNRRQYENVVIEFDNAIDGITLQVHDLFRFAHPLPGWGISGRVQEGSTQVTLVLDEDVTMIGGVTYQVYLRHIDDLTEARIVFNPGTTTTRTLQFGVPFSFQPTPRETLWAFGTAEPDSAAKVFRVVKMQRKSDTTVSLQAVIHNPSIYDEITASPLPGTPGLFNPLGPPPPLTFLVATEVTRMQASGASLRVVNLAWDVAGLGPGLAPYGGVTIYRRTVLLNSTAGNVVAGGIDFGAIQDPNDPNVNFVQLVQVTGHVLETDDYTVVTGGTYLYRAVPVSGRGVPNIAGSLDALIHVAGPTTPDFFPGTVRNLRLRGQAVGVLTWEGRDVHLVWDTVSDSPLFSETFFVADYIVQVWAPGMEYLMRSTNTGGVLGFTYTFDMNQEDQIRTGKAGARRDLFFRVFARTNTGRISLEPATLAVSNPPPDMSIILPDTVGLFETAIISWDQFAEPLDFDHYELHLDTQNPPFAIYQDIAISFHGQGSNFRKVFPQGLIQDVTYYTFVLPYDTFGPGIASQTASFTPGSLTADKLDSVPPGTPTGLVLTTGTDISDDGTIMPWVRASWTLAPEADVAGYEVHVFVGADPSPTVWNPQRSQTSIRFAVPGNLTVRVKLLAFDRFHNLSDFSAESTITTGSDTTGPAAPTNLTTVGSIKSVALLWTPPADLDYAYSQVFAATTNNRALATQVGTGLHGFVHDGLGVNDTRFYWIRAMDTSGNVSAAFHPASATAGVSGTAGQLDTTYISSLAADKIIAGTIQSLVTLGVGGNILLDGPQRLITIIDANGIIRMQMGRLGTLADGWGLRLFNGLGQLMWNITDGAQTRGISDAAITAPKIAAATVQASHLRTDTAVITVAAQIANAIINDAHINNLAAGKILAGTIGVQLLLGVGSNIRLDGVNTFIQILDANTVQRVLLGKLGPLLTDYGLNIYDQFGNLMWAFNSGAQTAGIATSAVVTEKITPNAVTESLLFVGSGGGVVSAGETEYASVTWPTLNAGDQVLLIGTCMAHGDGVTNNVLVLREDSLAGGAHHVAGDISSIASLTVLAVYTAGGTVSNKKFLLSAVGNGSVTDIRLAALRRRR